MERYIQ